MADPKSRSKPPPTASANPQTGKLRTGEGAPVAPPSCGLIVGVGASAGGLEAFSELLKNLPTDTGMAFVLVQHLDPRHGSVLAELLASWTRMPVIQVHGDIPVQHDQVYVIPPNATMVIANRMLKLNPPSESPSHQRRPVDIFFKALAEDVHSDAIGIVLSGAASDGTLGLEAIKAEGGITFAQDTTAKFDGMPRSAIAAGFVDFILSPRSIAQELATIARHPLRAQPAENRLEYRSTLDKILMLLRNQTGVDFEQYKEATIHRRLERRMVVQKTATAEQYFELLQREPAEVDALFDDCLIKVTEFFRDAAVFDALKKAVFPAIVRDRGRRDVLRVWVPGCSSGEEVYSIVISLLEYLEAEGISISVQMFGTDASDRVVEKARTGIYNDSGVTDLSPERLRRFFVRTDSGYQVRRDVRDLCTFARHNLGKDPPLSHMDLISCRNLLIYFAPALQQRVIETLAYALRPTGCLLLGPSENTGRLAELFDPMDEEHKIYRKKADIGARTLEFITSLISEPAAGLEAPARVEHHASKGGVQTFVDRMLLSRFGPSGVVVDKNFRIVEFRGEVDSFLRTSGGQANLDLLTVVREDLAVHLRSAIEDAHNRRTTVRLDEIQVRQDRAFHFVRITVIPVSIHSSDPYSVVLFENLADSTELALKRVATLPTPPLPPAIFENPDRHIEHLEQELASSREYLQSIIEEMRSTNEEAQSANEELQTSNEELQTTKEELQASNEELNTVNAEMQSRNVQLGQANDDLVNLLGSISTPIVMVDNDLRIRRFTPMAEKVLCLIPADVGRPISNIKPRINVADLDEILTGVLNSLAVHEQEVQDNEGRSYLMRVRPYRTADNRIDGAVLILVDITDLKHSGEEVRRARDYAEAIVDTVREPLVVLDESLAVRTVNTSFYKFFHVGSQELRGRNLYEIAEKQFDLPQLRGLLDRLLAGQRQLNDVEVEHDFRLIGTRTMLLNARRISETDNAGLILLAFEDITERKRASEARYRRLFESAHDGIIIVDAATGEIADLNPYTEQLLGYGRQEITGQKLWETEPLRENPGIRTALEQIRDQGVARFSDMSFKTKDGHKIQTELIGNVYSEGSRRAIQLNIRDLTERKKFERELQHTQRLESLGLLAGGVAHDFNNLLTGILGNASLVYSEIPGDNPGRNRVREIVRAAERAADLTRQLLAYAGKGRFVIEPIRLSELIREILVLIQSSIPKTVELKLDLTSGLPPIEADAAQLQQLIMNVVINAAEAIGEAKPGTVEIRTALRELSTQDVRENFSFDEIVPGSYVLLEIKDTGSGMDEATKAKIFDPFFTTKFTGRGLGLAAALGIVKTLHGAIRVYSTPGHGTSFHILFPAATPTQAVSRAVRLPQKRVRGSGTVLVIDDESTVRQVASAALQRNGFEVLAAENGQAGVDLFRSQSDRISLVLLDLTMPVMGGEQAFDLLRAIRADIPVVLSSGYDESEAAGKFAGKNFAGFIHKPYDVSRLIEAVSSALGLETEE